MSVADLSRISTWANMSERRASKSRLDDYPSSSSSSSSSIRSEGGDNALSVYHETLGDILNPSRLAALDAADVAPVPYHPYSFFSYIMTVHGRNLPMIVAPLSALTLWGLGWQLFFHFGVTKNGDIVHLQDYLSAMNDLIAPLLTPLSFMLTFRLARAAIRFWDARAAAGKMVEICRSNIATVSAGLISPVRLRNRQMRKQNEDDGKQHSIGEDAMALLCEYARWLTVFPISVKHFLRPAKRPGWENESRYKKRRYEIGPLLSDDDAMRVIMAYDDKDGKPTFDASATHARIPPLVVLNRMHLLAYDIAYFPSNGSAVSLPTPQGQSMLYQQITSQIDILTGTFGAMERIKGTPLPFAYAIHLRTFLLLYLFLWNCCSVAQYDWIALPFLFLFNWCILGIEAAAVECERPFDYNPNHLTLGRIAVMIAKNIGQALKETMMYE